MSPASADISRAARILKQGGVVAFPTETVYGLGARFNDLRAVRKIFAVKGRPQDNPLIVHISRMDQLTKIARNVSPESARLMKKFWPGPLTLIFKRTRFVPKLVTAGLDTVAVRMPDHPAARALIDQCGSPIAAPSANRSGRPSPTRYQDVLRELSGQADFILDGGKTRAGLESTVVDTLSRPPRLLRAGHIPAETLRKYLPGLTISHAHSSHTKNMSPGMKHRHYQPKCPVLAVAPGNWQQALSTRQNRTAKSAWSRTTGPIRATRALFSNATGTPLFPITRANSIPIFDAEQAGVELLLVEPSPTRHWSSHHGPYHRGQSMSAALDRAFAHCENMAKSHYENFPVGSSFLPKDNRKYIWAIYAFARTADDFADEGRHARETPGDLKQRLDQLDDWELRLMQCSRGEAKDPRSSRSPKPSARSICRSSFSKTCSPHTAWT